MDPVQKALWFVESHLRDPLTLDEVAGHSGVSPYHLTRAFAAFAAIWSKWLSASGHKAAMLRRSNATEPNSILRPEAAASKSGYRSSLETAVPDR